MTSDPQPHPHLLPTMLTLPSAAPTELNATGCSEWQQSHQLLFHLGNLSLLLGLLLPTTLGLHMVALRLLLMTGQCRAPLPPPRVLSTSYIYI